MIEPRFGYLVLKKIKPEKSILPQGNLEQDRGYAKIHALPDIYDKVQFKDELKVGDTVIYEALEGQEVLPFGEIQEEGLVLIKEDKIIARII